MDDIIEIKAYKCKWCGKVFEDLDEALKHDQIDCCRCYDNPKMKRCATCANWKPKGNAHKCSLIEDKKRNITHKFETCEKWVNKYEPAGADK